MSDVQLLWLHISMGCVHLWCQTTKLWYWCLLPQRKARSNLTHWCFVVRESSYHEQDSIARYMVLDIWFFVFGWFKVIILKMYHKVASILLHSQVLLYLPLLERLEYSGMFICFIHTIWQTQKKNKEEKRVLSRILLCLLSVYWQCCVIRQIGQ